MIITMCRFNCMNKLPARQAGAAMVEFAILLPLMIVLVFGITEMGRAIYQQNTLSKAVASGARYMSRSAQSVNADCTQAGQWGPSSIMPQIWWLLVIRQETVMPYCQT